MKKHLLLACAALMLPGIAHAQWNYAGDFPSDTTSYGGNGVHGIAVDGEGKIWVQPFGATDSVLVTQSGAQGRVAVLYVYNPDGTPADFSPVKFATIDGVTDTLGGTWNGTAWSSRTGRGLRTDVNGNILAAFNNIVYRLDHENGAGMNKLVQTTTGSITAPANDAANRTYVAPVVGGTPVAVYDEDFNFVENAIEATTGFSRAFEVSPDGNSIYWGGYTNDAVILYQRPDEFSAYDSIGVVIPGVDSEAFAWHPVTGDLWVGSGSLNDPPNDYVTPAGDTVATNYAPQAWYAFDPADLTVESAQTLSGFAQAQDSINFFEPGIGRPRGIDFSPDGTTAYVAFFSQDLPSVQKFVAADPNAVVSEGPARGFTLKQNAPNPFRGTTYINFSVEKAGKVTLRVYDVLGREVATLVDRHMAAGGYKADFSAAGLASGTYLYVLEADGSRQAKRMVVVR